jgi:hypothetical protein
VKSEAGYRTVLNLSREGNVFTVELDSVPDASRRTVETEELSIPFPRLREGRYQVRYLIAGALVGGGSFDQERVL